MTSTRLQIQRGIVDTLPLSLPAIPFAMVFGLVVAESGVGSALGWSSSPIVFGGAAQVTLLTLIGEGASAAAAATAALIVSARHLLYSVTLAPHFQQQPRWFRWVGPYVLIDQVFALSVLRRTDPPDAFRVYFLSAGFAFWALWLLYTAVGLFLGPLVPASWELSFAAPVMFTTLLVAATTSWEKLLVALLAGLVTAALADLPNRGSLLLGALLGIALGLLIELLRKPR